MGLGLWVLIGIIIVSFVAIIVAVIVLGTGKPVPPKPILRTPIPAEAATLVVNGINAGIKQLADIKYPITISGCTPGTIDRLVFCDLNFSGRFEAGGIAACQTVRGACYVEKLFNVDSWRTTRAYFCCDIFTKAQLKDLASREYLFCNPNCNRQSPGCLINLERFAEITRTPTYHPIVKPDAIPDASIQSCEGVIPAGPSDSSNVCERQYQACVERTKATWNVTINTVNGLETLRFANISDVTGNSTSTGYTVGMTLTGTVVVTGDARVSSTLSPTFSGRVDLGTVQFSVRLTATINCQTGTAHVTTSDLKVSNVHVRFRNSEYYQLLNDAPFVNAAVTSALESNLPTTLNEVIRDSLSLVPIDYGQVCRVLS